MWELCLFLGRPPVPLKKVANGIFGLTQKETGTKGVAMATIYSRGHFVSLVMNSSGAKFEVSTAHQTQHDIDKSKPDKN